METVIKVYGVTFSLQLGMDEELNICQPFSWLCKQDTLHMLTLSFIPQFTRLLFHPMHLRRKKTNLFLFFYLPLCYRPARSFYSFFLFRSFSSPSSIYLFLPPFLSFSSLLSHPSSHYAPFLRYSNKVKSGYFFPRENI